MAIQVGGTTVLNNSRQLTNITGADTATKNALASAGIGGVESGSATQIGSTLNFGTPSGSYSSAQSITLPDFGQGLRNITIKFSFNYSVSYGGFYGGAEFRWRTSNMPSGQYQTTQTTYWSGSIASSFSGFYSFPVLPQAVWYGDSTTQKYYYDNDSAYKLVNPNSTWSHSVQNPDNISNVASGDSLSVEVRNYNNDSRGAGTTSNAQIQLWIWDRN